MERRGLSLRERSSLLKILQVRRLLSLFAQCAGYIDQGHPNIYLVHHTWWQDIYETCVYGSKRGFCHFLCQRVVGWLI